MNVEAAILSEVEALKAKFSDTRALYREVCGLLFFRFGITPTGNRLYQYVRRGSMNVPTEEVGKFWDDLRHRARVDIQHPDLPDGIKAVAAEAVAALWKQATEAARGELAAARLELQKEEEKALAERDAANQELSRVQADIAREREEMEQIQAECRATREELEAERRGHAGTQARVQQMQSQLDEVSRQQQAQREGFATELAKTREAVEAANERAAGAERRALKEIEQERQARIRAEKTADQCRENLAAVEARATKEALAHAEAATRLQMELNAKATALARALEEHGAMVSEVDEYRRSLEQVKQQATAHEAEARTLQGLMDRLSIAPPAASPRGNRKKAPGP